MNEYFIYYTESNPVCFVILAIMLAHDLSGIDRQEKQIKYDRAPVLIADALRRAVQTCGLPPFLARYGGDEFIAVASLPPGGDPETLAREIRRQLREGCAAAETPYQITVGVGYDELHAGEDTFQRCQQRADHKLYLDKEAVKLRLREQT